jgi:di/tricarboxylate transporter
VDEYPSPERFQEEVKPQISEAHKKVSFKRNSPSRKSDLRETGTELLDLVRLQLLSEADLKKSLETRAMAIIATSGAFVTLLLGFITWAAPHSTKIPLASKILVALGVLLLVAAAIGSITVRERRQLTR